MTEPTASSTAREVKFCERRSAGQQSRRPAPASRLVVCACECAGVGGVGAGARTSDGISCRPVICPRADSTTRSRRQPIGLRCLGEALACIGLRLDARACRSPAGASRAPQCRRSPGRSLRGWCLPVTSTVGVRRASVERAAMPADRENSARERAREREREGGRVGGSSSASCRRWRRERDGRRPNAPGAHRSGAHYAAPAHGRGHAAQASLQHRAGAATAAEARSSWPWCAAAAALWLCAEHCQTCEFAQTSPFPAVHMNRAQQQCTGAVATKYGWIYIEETI
jgi:hypothetical protein